MPARTLAARRLVSSIAARAGKLFAALAATATMAACVRAPSLARIHCSVSCLRASSVELSIQLDPPGQPLTLGG